MSFDVLGMPVVRLAVLLLIMGAANAQETPERSITAIGENLYRAQNNRHHSLFLVTDQGIILTDPINVDFSTWLSGELAERFGVPVRYVLYSHRHADHASGGAVFADTAEFVGHENMVRGLAASPSDDVVVPTLTYKDRLVITLGGKQAEMIYTGNQTHTDDMSVIRFPDEEVIYVVDFISLHNIPGWPVGAGLLDAWLNAIRLVEALDYEIVAPSHGVIGRRADVADVRHYVEALRNEVAAGIAAGLSVENMQATITMEQYRDWPRYGDFHRRNVEGMYRMLTD